MPCALLAIPLAIAVPGNSVPPTVPPVPNSNQLARDTDRIVFLEGRTHLVPLGGDRFRPVRSMLAVRGPMTYGQYRWNDIETSSGPIWVRVDTAAQTLSVFRGSDEIGTAVILYGAGSKPTPSGQFRVLERIADHRSRTYDAPMPYTLRLTADGVAIHGSDVVRGAATHGCIGVPIEFAQRLFAVTRRGDEVYVVDQAPTLGPGSPGRAT